MTVERTVGKLRVPQSAKTYTATSREEGAMDHGCSVTFAIGRAGCSGQPRRRISRPLTMLRPLIASLWTIADGLAKLVSRCTTCP